MDEIGHLDYNPTILTAPTVAYLKQLAFKDKEMPSGLVSSAQTFYIKARALYRARIEPERGKREMDEFERAYQTDWNTEEQNYRISLLWKRIELPAMDYTDGPTIESADKFFAAVYGLPENWRVKR